ncbi:MAG TPA: hypothetical protein VFX59_13005, partial [Polyangiales bacterium]|nr:hypothetical protein [Polyangiales bacterium]
FARSVDGQQVWRYNGTPNNWTQIGGPSSRLIGSGSSALYSIYPPTGDIYQYNGTPGSWTYIGPSRAEFVANDSALYARSAGGAQVFKYSGTPGTWTVIGGASNGLFAGGTALFSIYPPTGDIYQFNPSTSVWSFLTGPGLRFAANRRGLYKQSSDGLEIFRLSGGTTTKVGGAGIVGFNAAADTFVTVHSSNDLLMLLNP